MIKPTIRKIRYALFAGYFFIWFFFGILYQSAAIRSAGQDFTFQSDIKVISHVKAFKSYRKISIDDEIVEKLISDKSIERMMVPVEHDGISPQYLFTNEPIGYNWANYYVALLEEQGITHFSVTVENQEKSPLYYHERLLIDGSVKNRALYRVKLTFYKGPPEILPDTDQIKNYTPIRSETIWTLRKLTPLKDLNGKIHNLWPTWLLLGVLEDSTNYIDDSLFTLRSIISGRFWYPLIDFLYFSAITLTTVGYGDILPNTSYIRFLVMVEALLGVLVVGAIINTFFAERSSNRSEKSKDTET